ncbi:NUDIX hydrolase [Nesterenkonia ebinurensis]|uniref:NUDIX hydrolase n=1 Tax=Nesterenkonia ebinurensis TaxID=2608252 RepID=UPI00168AC942|nr:CoA pyrophosphatase [Nesterenkonia ebinurensis]
MPENPLPTTHQELTASLRGLVQLGAEYAEQSPEDAAAGVWWWGIPASEVHQHGAAPPTTREAAVLALFWPTPEGPQVLLTERSPELAKHPGQISFPGGGAEEFDSGPVATALREAQEETGLDPRRVTVIGTLPVAPIRISGFVVTPVAAVAEDPGVLAPQSGEVSRVLKIPVADLVEPQHRHTAVVVHRGPRLPSPAYLRTPGGPLSAPLPQPSRPKAPQSRRSEPHGEQEGWFIWGFTGTLLDRMLHRFGWERDWDRSKEIDPRHFRR